MLNKDVMAEVTEQMDGLADERQSGDTGLLEKMDTRSSRVFDPEIV